MAIFSSTLHYHNTDDAKLWGTPEQSVLMESAT